MSATIAGRAMPRLVHYKRIGVAGLFLGIGALALLSIFASSLNLWTAEALVLALGLRVGPVFPTVTVGVSKRRRSAGSRHRRTAGRWLSCARSAAPSGLR